MKLEFSRQIFEKNSNIKFCRNPSSGSRVVLCGQTDMAKVIVAFRNFTNAAKKDLKEICWVGVDYIHVAQVRDKRLAVVCAVMNIRVPINARNFSTS